jgi:hypothetical protein
MPTARAHSVPCFRFRDLSLPGHGHAHHRRIEVLATHGAEEGLGPKEKTPPSPATVQ